MFGFLRPKPQSLPDTALAMVDPRPADNVLFTSAAAAALAGACGAVTRLNGRTLVLVRNAGEVAAVEKAAEKAGGLIETVEHPGAGAPPMTDAFQIVVAPDLASWPPDTWPGHFNRLAQLLAPGGRLIATAQATRVDADRVVRALTSAGFVAARRLAEANRVEYFEARKPRMI
jgi:hypothetical protein